MSTPALSRRRFLQASGAGLTVAFLAGCALPVIPKRPAPTLGDAMGWVQARDGRFVLFIPRVEMGQNVLTALKQIACEELGAGWDQVEARLPSTRDIARARATVGSDSIKDFALPLAQACAVLRDALAAGQTQASLQPRERPMAELHAFRPGRLAHIGREAPLEQGEAIVRGQPLYVADVRRPGQCFGRVIRAPASPELKATLRTMNEAAARAVPGFVALVRDERLAQGHSEGIGLVARTPAALNRIEAALEAQWTVEARDLAAEVAALIDVDSPSNRRLSHAIHDDPLPADAPWQIDLRFDIPLAAHAAIEPRAAVAEFGPDGHLQLWVGSQDVFYQRDVMAKRFGLSDQQVTVHAMRVGGAFGGKTICTVELEAAVLARASGQPVKVQWTRAQEFRQGFHRPPSSHRVRVRLHDGRLQHWSHRFVSSHILFTNAAMPVWMQRAADLIGDAGVARGATLPYRAAARSTRFDAVRLPVFTGPWRGLGAGPNSFVIESVMDECARLAHADPVAFRLAHIDDPRLARVLQRASERAGWSTPQTAAEGQPRRGRGVACGIYKAMSYAAVVAEVEVADDGTVRVTRLVCVHDCGRVVHPGQVRAQCEGNLVWGLGMVLTDALPLAGAEVAAEGFAQSPIPRLGDVPAMDVVLVDEGDAPSGAGETAIVAAAGAIANAVRDATGVRVTRLPVAAAALARTAR
jgi:isoquinoline 1-oxidoreductase beta subunit